MPARYGLSRLFAIASSRAPFRVQSVTACARASVTASEDPQALLQTVIGWGRYAELIGYDSNQDRVYLDEDGVAAYGVKA